MRRDLTQPSPSINLVNENEGDFEHMRLHEGSQSPVNPFEPEQPHREYDYSPQRLTDSDSFHFQTSNEEKGGPEYQAQEQNRYHIESQDVLTYNQYVPQRVPRFK